MDKKIGIITFHNADNYGAILQTYATQVFLKNNNFNAVIIDYFHNNSSASRPLILKLLSYIKAFLKTNSRRAFIKHLKCNAFRNKFLEKTKKYFGDQSIIADPPIMDIYISGSDQILNFDLTDKSNAFYLSFVNRGKKISYASSFGKSVLNKDEIVAVTKYLSSFDALSFREKDGYLLASKYILNCKENIVVDPVFLLETKEWDDLISNEKAPIKNYIFIYGIEYNELFIKTIQEVKKQYNLPIYASFSSSFTCPKYLKDVTIASPTKFLNLLRNAHLVVTNSFHGTAFALIFRKQFICVDPLVRRSRIVEILKKTNCSDLLLTELHSSILLHNYVIDGETSYIKLKDNILESKNFLLGAIKHD